LQLGQALFCQRDLQRANVQETGAVAMRQALKLADGLLGEEVHHPGRAGSRYKPGGMRGASKRVKQRITVDECHVGPAALG
jgi:hypothetical protein